jgi:hypothetical protein
LTGIFISFTRKPEVPFHSVVNNFQMGDEEMKPISGRDGIRTIVVVTLCTIISACGGNVVKAILPGISNSFKHLTAAASSGFRVYRPEAGVKAMALFQTGGATASALQQSFQGKCTFTVDTTTIPSGALIPLVLDRRGDAQNCNEWFTAGPDNPDFGSLVVENGTVGTLVVIGDASGAPNLVCKDLVNTGAVADGELISVWFRPSDNAVLLFHGTPSGQATQLPTTCTLPIPAGASMQDISAQFLKD